MKRLFVVCAVVVLLNTIAASEEAKIKDIVNGAVGPFEIYCDGYGNPEANGLGYVSVLKLETGVVKKEKLK